MKFLLILILPIFIWAKTYMGLIEPIQKYDFYAETTGEIVILNNNDETKKVTKNIITIDSILEEKTLKLYKEQLNFNLKKLKINEENYKKFIKITGKSKVEKDLKFIEILSLKNTINSLKINIIDLENTLKNKKIYVKNLYIKKFFVNKHDYVSKGTKLFEAYDTSKSKVIVFVNKNDFKNIYNKIIYINGKRTNFKIFKADITTDSTFISSHKVSFYIDSKLFGTPVKVEFKND